MYIQDKPAIALKMIRTSNPNINSIMLYHWAIKALHFFSRLNLLLVKKKWTDKGVEPLSTDHESVMLTITLIRLLTFRKKRNWTFDSKRLLSLQLNPSYQQTGPSLGFNVNVFHLLFLLKQKKAKNMTKIFFLKYVINPISKFIFNVNSSRAISTTRTIFRLNTH